MERMQTETLPKELLEAANNGDWKSVLTRAQEWANTGDWANAKAGFELLVNISSRFEAESLRRKEESQQASEVEMNVPIIVDTTPLPKPKYDWYQSETHVFVTLQARKVAKDDLLLQYSQDGTVLTIEIRGKSRLEIRFYAKISPQNSTFTITEYKVELKLCKAIPGNWPKLETSVVEPAKAETAALPKPYSSKKANLDWKKIEKEVGEDDQDSGDPLNALFKKIYATADEDTRRAMIKSYQTSGGTVLTTNWKEAAEKDFAKEIKPPRGQVYKSWEGDVLAKDEDDD